mmetsp:Transcript_8931/g.29538  ORF Transcript_8931/g.29538 Transcript_8931/m.29538 type:complete len:113 (-) Transcript_8931:685-1023(-)
MKAAQVLLLVVALVAALLAPAAEALRPCIEAPEGGLRAGGFTAREHDDPTIAEVTKFAYYELERNNPSVVKFVDVRARSPHRGKKRGVAPPHAFLKPPAHRRAAPRPRSLLA